MLKSNKGKIIAASLFFAVQILFWISLITTGKEHFTSIALSCSFAILSFAKSKNYAFIQAGLVFTVIADIFLVVCNPIIQLPAMISFSFTQICYFLKLYLETERKAERHIHISLRAFSVVVIIVATIVVLKEKTDALSLVSMFYYANLALNVVFAFVHLKKSPFFAVGLLLFILCDTVVGFKELSNSYLSGGIIDVVNNVLSGANWAWIFYIPAQALISFSLVKFNKMSKKKSST